MATQKPRIMVTVDEDLYKMIIEFKEANGYSNLSQAAEVLARIGLQELLKNPPDPTPKRPTRKKRNKDGDSDEA